MISKSSNRACLGFSLTELAIVLAIIGVVLAALWGVVSIVRENIRREETAKQLTVIVQNIRDFYMGRACISSATNMGCPGGTDLANYLFRQNVLLPEQLRDRTAGTLVADHPWGGPTAEGTLRVHAVGDGKRSFSIELNSLKRSSCTALVGELSGTGGPKGLTAVRVNDVDIVPLPVPPESADAACNDNDPENKIILTYNLRS